MSERNHKANEAAAAANAASANARAQADAAQHARPNASGGASAPACAPFAEAVVLSVYGEVPPGELAALEAHLAGCASCRAELCEARALTDALDGLTVPEPEAAAWAVLESRLETRVAPLRARRLARGASRGLFAVRFGRMAAALAVAGLSGLLGVMTVENRRLATETLEQREQVAELTRELGDLKYAAGDVRGAFERYEWALRNHGELSPAQARRLRLKEALRALPEGLVQAWTEAVRGDASEQRQRLIEILWHYPEQGLADDAFAVLRATTSPERPARLRPLEEAAAQPLGVVRPPFATADASTHYRAELARLEDASRAMPEPIMGWPLLRAGRLAEEQLRDPDRARSLYGRARASADGPIREAAERRLAALDAADREIPPR